MKKFVSGIIVGVLLFTSASVFADSNSLIGKKVQGLFSIEKNGTKIADAVIINGSTYAPVRALSDATGIALTVEGKKIIMGETSSAVVTPSSAPGVKSTDTTLDELKAQREKVSKSIAEYENHIKLLNETAIPVQKELLKNSQSDVNKKSIQAQLEQYEELLKTKSNELVTLKQQLTDLDSQIAELQK